MDNKARKRSSLKTSNLFDNMSVEEFLASNKLKSIKWDQKMVIEEEGNPDGETNENSEYVSRKPPNKLER
jgi:hypothetical protein